jgi:uncharacterized protein (TIGR02145 family)
MKKRSIIILSLMILFVFFGCTDDESKDELALITTSEASSITATTAVSGGYVNSDGGSTVTAKGVCWDTLINPTTADSKTNDGEGTGGFGSNITGLRPNKTYYVRAYAVNGVGTAYGNEIHFTSLDGTAPPVTTASITNVTANSAVSGGTISSDGGAPVTARGVCWDTSTYPTLNDSFTIDGYGNGIFICQLLNLSPSTTYYVRAYATNNYGTAYGEQVVFTTLNGIITDIDGNIYHTIRIGTQAWLVENLMNSRYRNGDNIAFVIDGTSWSNLSTGAYCYYNNDTANEHTYGHLYNWFAVKDSRNITPTGWHIPSDEEWTTLINYLGGSDFAGSKLKEIGTIHWLEPNSGATNESGFTALPGGARGFDGSFFEIQSVGYWWSSTEYNSTNAWRRRIFNNQTGIYRNNPDKKYGFSVRCVRD